MSGFLEKYNTDDVFLRNLIISFIRSLNEKLVYYQVNDQQQVLKVYIPFFYSMTGDESFLQDFYIEYKNCLTDEPHAEGNYDVVPRGIVTMGAPQIDVAGILNPNVRMSYTIEDNQGMMKTLSSFTKPIPLTVDFDIKIICDSVLDSFKIYQSAITTFYKTYTFSFEFEGFRIVAIAGFPEAITSDKQYDFSYGNSQKVITNSLSVQVQTYFPEKDLTTERFRGNVMQAGIRAVQKLDEKNIDRGNNEIL
jgi:hypothetical protein